MRQIKMNESLLLPSRLQGSQFHIKQVSPLQFSNYSELLQTNSCNFVACRSQQYSKHKNACSPICWASAIGLRCNEISVL